MGLFVGRRLIIQVWGKHIKRDALTHLLREAADRDIDRVQAEAYFNNSPKEVLRPEGKSRVFGGTLLGLTVN